MIATEQAEREVEMIWGEKIPLVPAVKPTVTINVKIAIRGMYRSKA